jgi:hypothetical protein
MGDYDYETQEWSRDDKIQYAADAAHIAANDPATVLVLLDVVEAARSAAGADINYPMGAVYHDGLKAALDRLKEVLR